MTGHTPARARESTLDRWMRYIGIAMNISSTPTASRSHTHQGVEFLIVNAQAMRAAITNIAPMIINQNQTSS